MPAFDQAMVVFVISTFSIFGIVLAYASWQTAMAEKDRNKQKSKK